MVAKVPVMTRRGFFAALPLAAGAVFVPANTVSAAPSIEPVDKRLAAVEARLDAMRAVNREVVSVKMADGTTWLLLAVKG